VTKFDYTTVFPRKSEKTAEDWLTVLEKLPPALIYISGGEPMLYGPLPDIINNLPAKHQILAMVSNASMPMKVYDRIRKPPHLNLSFHREFISEDEFIGKVKELQRRFHLAVNIVATAENLPVIEQVAAMMKDHNITLHVDPLVDTDCTYTAQQENLLAKYTYADRKYTIDFDDYSVKHCSAGRNYIHLMPGGEVYTCAGGCSYLHSPLFKDVVLGADVSMYAMGNIFDPGFRLNSKDITCELPCKDACDRDSVIIKVIAPAPPKLPLATS